MPFCVCVYADQTSAQAHKLSCVCRQIRHTHTHTMFCVCMQIRHTNHVLCVHAEQTHTLCSVCACRADTYTPCSVYAYRSGTHTRTPCSVCACRSDTHTHAVFCVCTQLRQALTQNPRTPDSRSTSATTARQPVCAPRGSLPSCFSLDWACLQLCACAGTLKPGCQSIALAARVCLSQGTLKLGYA